MSFRQFLSEWHVQVEQSAGQRMIEKVLADRGVELKVAVRLPSFLGVSLILVNTDLVVTVPDLLGRSLATSPLRHVKAVPAPFAVPTYTCQPTPCASTGTSATITTCRVNGCGKLWPTCSWNQTSHPGMACNLKYREKKSRNPEQRRALLVPPVPKQSSGSTGRPLPIAPNWKQRPRDQSRDS